MTTAKLFWTGHSQAVRLPKEFRFEGKEVHIRREGQQVIIEPITSSWDWLDKLGEPDPSFAQAIDELKQSHPNERDWSIFE